MTMPELRTNDGSGDFPDSTGADHIPLGHINILAPMAGYVIPLCIALLVISTVWEISTIISNTPVYILPAPSDILRKLVAEPHLFFIEGSITLGEALAGFMLGACLALASAFLMAHSSLLERSLFPLAILIKVTPIVAIAPLFVIWFGFGPIPKILIAMIMSFFPVLVNAVTGFRAVDPLGLDLMRSLGASRWEIFSILRIPYSLPYLFSAFRVAIPLSIIGAVVGEWFSADRGLGSTIIVAHNNLDMPTLFGAIATLAFIGIMLTTTLAIIERKVLFWHQSSLVE